MLRICVKTDVSGHHGYQPPEREIGRTVKDWLYDCLKEGSLVVQDDQPTKFNGQLDFTVSVECHRIAADRNYYGVKAVKLQNPTTVELRVRPNGSDYRWPCFLACPDQMVALTIIGRSRPNAMIYMGYLVEELRLRLQLQNSEQEPPAGKSRRERRPKRERKQRQEDVVREEIKQTLALAHFSYLFQQTLNGSTEPEVTGSDVIRMATVAVRRTNVSEEAALMLLFTLTEGAIIEPVSRTGDQLFTPGVVIAEHVAWYEEYLRAQQRDRVQADINHTNRLIAASQAREHQLEEALQAERTKQAALQIELNGFEAQLAAIPHPRDDG